MRELLLASPRDPLENLVKREIVTVPVDMPRDEVGTLIQRRRFVALPVVDRDGHLLGVVKPDEVLEAFQQEAFGDLQKMVGAGEDERALSPISVVVSKRLPWLYVNLATAFLASTVVGLFESTIEQVTALAVLMPMVAGQGGNTGAQSLAVVMRGLALRELVPGRPRACCGKEAVRRADQRPLRGAGHGPRRVPLGRPDRARAGDHARDGREHDRRGAVRGGDPADPARARPRSRAVGLDLPHHRHRRGRVSPHSWALRVLLLPLLR